MLRRCSVSCIYPGLCILGLNINFDLDLAKYIFQVMCLDYRDHEVKLNENRINLRSDIKPQPVRMI
eukprot:snap_masked-scaffold_1-processed-gene-5.14-mRNA-1 protein AED:1.00 eAED:1.00 QI:0/-1/0/0/-1/1/1/0/65